MQSETIEKGLSLALESPDKVVRNLAIRREEVAHEMEQLDIFLGAYAELSAGRPLVSVSRETLPDKPAPARVAADFDAEIVRILTNHGSPMSLSALRTAYADKHGAEPEQNFYRRIKRREHVVELTPEGYWLTPVAPERGNGALNA